MGIYTIYKATNKVNHKSYIGYDSNWPQRQVDHSERAFYKSALDYNTYFHRAIRKYGPEAFEWEILYQANGDEELGKWVLNTMEPHFIQESKTHMYSEGHHGYNMTLGGEGGFGRKHSDETKRKMSIGRSGANNPNYGKHHSEEHRQKIRAALLGKPKVQRNIEGVIL